jgi:hypothetical protein
MTLGHGYKGQELHVRDTVGHYNAGSRWAHRWATLLDIFVGPDGRERGCLEWDSGRHTTALLERFRHWPGWSL